MSAHPSSPMRLPLAAVGPRISALAGGERLALTGIDRDEVGDLLRADLAVGRSALLLAHADRWDGNAIIDHLLDDLAGIALSRWPAWYRDAGPADDLLVRTARERHVSAPWLRAAMRLARAGKPPRLRKAERGFEVAQLLRATDPDGLIVIADVDPASPARAAVMIQVLEWCAARGIATVAALASAPPRLPPYDRVLHGALDIARAIPPVQARYIGAQGRAHGGSDTEARMQAALLRDPELGALFEYNRVVQTGAIGLQPRVDLLWREGRIVVELDGPEHFFDPAYGADRDRDYELMLAGYLVLRLTNAQVATDLERAVAKIRNVVRLRKAQGGGEP